MARATLDQLRSIMAEAYPIIGSLWRHTKSGTVYIVTGISIRESDNALLYSYRPAHELFTVFFTRPASEWHEVIDGVPRFKPWSDPDGREF